MNITPKNWDSFQHYKNRSPAWIKLHRGLLDDFEFNRLPLASRALAPMLWLLASEYEGGEITATTEAIAFRLRTTEEELTEAIKPLIEAGFFVSASDMLAPCKQSACLEERRERGREEENATKVATTAKAYAFESGVIHLNQKDFESWSIAFTHLDLRAELLSLTQWAASQRDWFHAVAGALAKRNREVGIKIKTPPPSSLGRPLDRNGNAWPDGIV